MKIKEYVFSGKRFSPVSLSLLCLAMLITIAACETPLHNAAYNGDVERVNILLMKGAEANEQWAGWGIPLHTAAKKGNADIVRALLKAGSDVNARTTTFNSWATPLHYAAENGHTEIVRILLDAGAEVNAKNKYGSTPLHLAVEGGHLDMVNVLLRAGAVVGVGDNRGRTPLEIARQGGHTTIARILERAEEERYLAAEKPSSYVPKEIAVTMPVTPLPDASSDITIESLDFGSYHALVIGNNDYQNLPKLRTAISDARSMADLLRAKYGYQVELLLNATRREILRALYSYRRTLTDRDNLLIYYAGHGWLDKDADEGYWLPVDAGRQDPANWISNSSITSSLRAMKAKHVLVVADSCYSGKLARGVNISLRSGNYYQRISMKKARTVMASGGLEPVEDDGGKGNHSVFASALIEALNENQGILDATLLFSKIRRPVMVNADQTPEYSDIRKAGHDGGDFLFVPR
jgi:hypothetical protein